MRRLVVLSILPLLLSVALVARASGEPGTSGGGLTPAQKVLATDLAVIGFIGAWGAANWDYGSNSWRTTDEGWFGRSTKEGGADKAGHLYSTYVIGRSLAGLFRTYGYDKHTAISRGALSALAAMSFMEFGDGFSPYGLSWEDQAMNVAGAALAWWMAAHPALDRRMALRAEYRFHAEHASDFFTDYERWRYYLVLKPGGFDAMPEPLRWVELHAGYFARGYHDEDPSNDRRSTFVGIGLSLPMIARRANLARTAVFLDYFQPPDTVLRHDDSR